jgi:RNA polymerase sigma factor (sigma-70 family)
METAEGLARRSVCWRGLADMEVHVRAFARRRCRDVHELDDVVQETLLRAARYRSGLTDESRLKPWTLRIAANVVRDRQRRDLERAHQNPEEALLAAVEGKEADPGAAGEWVRLTEFGVVMEHEALVGHVSRVISELPAADARVLRSYYTEPVSTARAASECGVATTLVKTRLYRARRRLRRRLTLVLDLQPWVERCSPSSPSGPAHGCRPPVPSPEEPR